ncbi:TPA: hypothetical protein N2G37_001161 [Salmonella enterica]|nr:hypothetical protein [Salmonella enterica subsp. enterica serovar Bovismorbificans]EIU5772766.1 hypothetical protein [Salmonella enterica]NYA57896.1 hypothetical protein [Salmonella enterica]HCL5273602.1 hypothetical protein [Salmonella enterica]
MFSRDHPHRQPFNARNSRFSERAIDQSLSSKPFGDNHSPVLWTTIYGNLEMWPETAHMMALLGIHPETYLVRITSPDHVDLENMLISGHSHTVAKIEDPYDLKPHPLLSGLMLPRTKPSKNLGLECLNVVYTNYRISRHRAKMSVLGYRKSNRDIVICFQMRDVLTVGGKIYRDASSSLENVLIVGLPAGSYIPFRII